MCFYGVQLHHLNPNGIQDIAIFVAMCQGYFRIPPHFDLWKFFFSVSMQTSRGEPGPIGCAGIHLRSDKAEEFIGLKLSRSNRGWQRGWFYLRNDPAYGVPEYNGNVVFEERPGSWHWGVPSGEVPRLRPLIDAVARLIQEGVSGMGIAGNYHARGVAPLMRRGVELGQMAAGADLRGSVLRGGPPSYAVVVALLRESFEDPVPRFPIEGHPPMHPDPGAIVIVSPCVAFSLTLVCYLTTLSYADLSQRCLQSLGGMVKASMPRLPEGAGQRAENRARNDQQRQEAEARRRRKGARTERRIAAEQQRKRREERQRRRQRGQSVSSTSEDVEVSESEGSSNPSAAIEAAYVVLESSSARRRSCRRPRSPAPG